VTDLARDALLQQLAALNEELEQRGGTPVYNVGAVDELLHDDELRQVVRQCLLEVMALREER
jgi:hypothetical protein